MRGNSRGSRGQATVEMALALVAGIVPLTFGLIAFAELAWTYHALAAITRQGARYAATHCWQDEAGSNVVTWMQSNAPPFPDRPQLASGGVQIQVSYWRHDPETHQSVPFSCDGGCSGRCVPDSVTVSIIGYQFNHCSHSRSRRSPQLSRSRAPEATRRRLFRLRERRDPELGDFIFEVRSVRTAALKGLEVLCRFN